MTFTAIAVVLLGYVVTARNVEENYNVQKNQKNNATLAI